jgi:23S rRNA pseudouridine2604 synthase
MMTTPVRLAKRVVEIAACSRREAELYIAGGWVTVEGRVEEAPQFMVGTQQVALLPGAKPVPTAPVTILLHQQPGEEPSILAGTQVPDDASGITPLSQHLIRLKPCLPLQAGAQGLSVFTQDGRVLRKLSQQAATIEQEYVVEVAGELVEGGLGRLNHGLSFNGQALPQQKVSWQSETRLRFALKGPQPEQIAHLCRSVGLQVLSMKRLRIGRLAMGKLPPGQWRYLAGYERF